MNIHERPTRIDSVRDVIDLAGGPEYTIALTRDGTVWSWGANPNGELGTGNLAARLLPARIEGLTGVVRVVSGLRHVAVLNTRLSTTVAPLAVTFSAPDTALMTLPNGRTTALRRHRF